MRKILLSGLVTAGALMLATSVLAGPLGTSRPFKAAGLGQTSVTATANPASFNSESAGTISATHLGKGLYLIDATQDWTGATWPTNPCAVVTGSLMFIAANGDKVFTAVAGTTCEVTPFVNTSYSSDLNLTVTGGTGRFAGVTGAFEITGTSTGPGDGSFDDVWTATGTISY